MEFRGGKIVRAGGCKEIKTQHRQLVTNARTDEYPVQETKEMSYMVPEIYISDLYSRLSHSTYLEVVTCLQHSHHRLMDRVLLTVGSDDTIHFIEMHGQISNSHTHHILYKGLFFSCLYSL